MKQSKPADQSRKDRGNSSNINAIYMQPQRHSQASLTSLPLLQYFVYGSIILYFGRSIFIPFSFALLISFVLQPVCAWMERKGFSRAGAVITAILLLLILGILMVALLITQFLGFLSEWPVVQTKILQSFNDLSQMFAEVFGMSRSQQHSILTKISEQSGSNVLQMIKNTLTTSAFSLVMIFLVPVYAFLILYYRKFWANNLTKLFPDERRGHIREILTLTIRAYYNFIKGMALVYIAVGSLNSIGLLLLGVPHAVLFGFIASILTFVPYIGIIAGSLLPITMAWITYDSIWYPVGIIAIFTFVQYLEANVIFPIAVSSRLNVNTLVMLLAIFTGGLVWGMAGMILFVPFVGIAKLVADSNPKWKTISMILGSENTK
ncbi:AI-2E family transporter [Ohtaekwangia koreensis]|uniref:Predicted PurR-regulated permease PerM n=1 Tax=Ohtaekwangia koreensis TaxID=688867 RepID=A0A1T5M6C1_9BACT|nr:AI-2E family transporter [Ohtaekwangia koreensis]SKC83429.1 Predicted PurR-regulated permease PerM [Ohtaekwangia koreensis]